MSEQIYTNNVSIVHFHVLCHFIAFTLFCREFTFVVIYAFFV